MSVINSQPLIGASGNQSTAYNLTRSLRFRSSASAYLNRTPASAGNLKTWTWSGWVKRSGISENNSFLSAGASSNSTDFAIFDIGNNNYLRAQIRVGGVDKLRLDSSAVFRDPSAWYHIVIHLDLDNATQADRFKMYVNGSRITAFSTNTNTLDNTLSPRVNNNVAHYISNNSISAGDYFNGYMAEVNFVDGQALTPSDFGETDTATGVWKPKKYTGTYGTNGFYLPFTNTTSTTTLGNDSSGNGNNWTTNNISLTAGTTYDSMTDVPTNTSATVANYPTLNPLSTTTGTYQDANLYFYGAGAWKTSSATMALPTTGKFYWEAVVSGNPFSPRGSTTAYSGFGLMTVASSFNNTTSPNVSTTGLFLGDSGYYNNFAGSATDAGVSFANADVVAMAVDLDANTFTFYKNNTSIASGTIGTTAGTPLIFAIASYDTSYATFKPNFGQRGFNYTPPSGFVALNTFNLPTPTIGATASTQANKYFDATTYSGTGTTNNVANAGSFKPDFVWIKNRSSTNSHQLTDSVRGVNTALASDLTIAEYTGDMNAFNSGGFQVTGSSNAVNNSGQTYVGWQWRASNATGVSNTDGTITSTVSANTTAGFSIVTYTGNGSTGTVGHGLGVAPKMIISKNRSAAENWRVAHTGLTNMASWHLNLDTTQAQSNSGAAIWNNTTPTSTIFGVGTDTSVSGNGNLIVAYCFAEVAGYSAFGSYTGNGSTDGPFVFTGFRPKFVLIKDTTGSTNYWNIVDTTRNTYNVMDLNLYPNRSDAEGTSTTLDALSNGFKIRTTGTNTNTNGNTYIYMALAETPFKYSLGR